MEQQLGNKNEPWERPHRRSPLLRNWSIAVLSWTGIFVFYSAGPVFQNYADTLYLIALGSFLLLGSIAVVARSIGRENGTKSKLGAPLIYYPRRWLRLYFDEPEENTSRRAGL